MFLQPRLDVAMNPAGDEGIRGCKGWGRALSFARGLCREDDARQQSHIRAQHQEEPCGPEEQQLFFKWAAVSVLRGIRKLGGLGSYTLVKNKK